jgi:hypothetical protein
MLDSRGVFMLDSRGVFMLDSRTDTAGHGMLLSNKY